MELIETAGGVVLVNADRRIGAVNPTQLGKLRAQGVPYRNLNDPALAELATRLIDGLAPARPPFGEMPPTTPQG